MSRKKSVEKELVWREIVKRQAEGGLSVRKFCAGEGISEPLLYAWRRKLRQRSSDTAQPRESKRRVDEPGNGRLFVPTIDNLAADNALLKRSLFGSRRERCTDPAQTRLFDASTLDPPQPDEPPKQPAASQPKRTSDDG
jgi:transposase-like protein